MDRGPQYISSIRKRVHNIHNILVNMESVHSSVWKSVHNKLVQYGKNVHNILVQKNVHNVSSIRKRVHNTLVQYRKCLQYNY